MSSASLKQQAMGMLEKMPEDASLEDILDELYLLAQVEAGIRDAAEGRVIPHEEMKRQVDQWLQNTD